ncbi:MAG: lipoate--protein ligase family protein [Anaerolineales bacterium]|nr:lipoate--protein ligase family protein [Anaerolineales bacterium]
MTIEYTNKEMNEMIVEQSGQETYERATWRVIESGLRDGATNMAVDEAIVEAVSAGISPPTLRFYGWEPACLSLGYGQEWEIADVENCATLGWDIVRRPTGGRAILHVDELTYSVAAPENEPRVVGGILESYKRLSEALLVGLHLMGLEPTRAQPYYSDHGPLGPACFDGPSNYEITMGQMKLLGSAQARRRGMVLQHGTLPLYGDITRIVDALHFDQPGQRTATRLRLRYRATTVMQSLGRRVEFADAVNFMREGFARRLNLELVAGELSAAEQARAAEIRREKFANDAWTRRI